MLSYNGTLGETQEVLYNQYLEEENAQRDLRGDYPLWFDPFQAGRYKVQQSFHIYVDNQKVGVLKLRKGYKQTYIQLIPVYEPLDGANIAKIETSLEAFLDDLKLKATQVITPEKTATYPIPAMLGSIAPKEAGGKRGVRDSTRKRAETFKAIKDANPRSSYVEVAMRASKESDEEITAENVRNAYRTMGWEWDRADRIR